MYQLLVSFTFYHCFRTLHILMYTVSPSTYLKTGQRLESPVLRNQCLSVFSTPSQSRTDTQWVTESTIMVGESESDDLPCIHLKVQW